MDALEHHHRYALALGLVVGFFDFIPLVGATLDAIVVALATRRSSSYANGGRQKGSKRRRWR